MVYVDPVQDKPLEPSAELYEEVEAQEYQRVPTPVPTSTTGYTRTPPLPGTVASPSRHHHGESSKPKSKSKSSAKPARPLTPSESKKLLNNIVKSGKDLKPDPKRSKKGVKVWLKNIEPGVPEIY
jgi:hypothetical protein